MSYQLLSEPIRRYIHDQGWGALRPIQDVAIRSIMGSENNYIIVAGTASGKTEAAFLPVLSNVDFRQPGVQVLYVAPLIALINDQFQRVEQLCLHMDVTVTKWHGEASVGAKKRLLQTPEGIMLITPESLEAMFVNRIADARRLFSNLKFIVIDEIHTFLGSDRGMHLQSLLSRIEQLSVATAPRVVGLSATIGDYLEAKKFTGKEAQTKVLVDKTPKEIDTVFRFYEQSGAEFTVSFIEMLYEEVKDKKVLIFPNSRGAAEELAVKLKKHAEREGGHLFYFSHHSSVDKELREYIEDFAKESARRNFCISCTSTLELGIDIGSVDMVVQIDSAHSIASLIQRVGRSGRREGQKSSLLMIATTPWDLLQSFSCWELYKIGFIEPLKKQEKPFDLLLHQILSILKETCGISANELVERIKRNVAFFGIIDEDVQYLLKYMISANLVEDLGRELIVGYEGEKLTNSRDFYSMFFTPELMKVMHEGKKIGDLQVGIIIELGDNIYLGAKIWKVAVVDLGAKIILVKPAMDGKRPKFTGGGGDIHPRIREKMLELIFSDAMPEQTDVLVAEGLQKLRLYFSDIAMEELLYDRPCIHTAKGTTMLYTFTGTRINHTLLFVFKSLGVACHHIEDESLFMFDIPDITAVWEDAKKAFSKIGTLVDVALLENPGQFNLSKWGAYLPNELKKEQILNLRFDLEGTWDLLQQIRFVKGKGIMELPPTEVHNKTATVYNITDDKAT